MDGVGGRGPSWPPGRNAMIGILEILEILEILRVYLADGC